MPEKNRSHTARQHAGAATEFGDPQLRATMHNFLKEEKEDSPSIWNLSTIAGIAIFLVSMFYILQLIGLGGIEVGGLVQALPFIGAGLIGFIGFGYFVGDRRRVKKERKQKQNERRDYFEEAFPEEENDDDIDVESELFGGSTSQKRRTSRRPSFDEYAFKQSKKLYKSRTDKKIGGVCGGLAKYLGIDSTIIRVLTVLALFFTSGVVFPAYIILMIVLDKEPKLPDDYRY